MALTSEVAVHDATAASVSPVHPVGLPDVVPVAVADAESNRTAHDLKAHPLAAAGDHDTTSVDVAGLPHAGFDTTGVSAALRVLSAADVTVTLLTLASEQACRIEYE
jgi:hypothetical protein